jgi:arginine decarboxylase
MLGVTYTRFFLTAGSGVASTGLNSFDVALINAGVGDTNLIKMSSILPPRVEQVGQTPLPGGDLVPLAYADYTFNRMAGEPVEFEYISAAVAVGIPADSTLPGLIMEHSGKFWDERTCEMKVIQMVEEGMSFRNRPVKEIKSSVANLSRGLCYPFGSVFAAVVLLP